MPQLCDCDRLDHLGSTDGHCLNLSTAGEEPEDPSLARWTRCGCCMADCPDVHPTPTPGFFDPAPGSVTFAAEHVATLPAVEQEQLRAREAVGEIRIRPRAESIPEAMRDVRILRTARKHMRDEDET
ncbi:hypothetical protein ACFWXB_16255 [Tsukamurella tyrosinosolvens]|uniref:hypothetical protein n=1 Tax=Tsukamurella tyrosinosolvens TaxID=57704 RepID=UPI003696F158